MKGAFSDFFVERVLSDLAPKGVAVLSFMHAKGGKTLFFKSTEERNQYATYFPLTMGHFFGKAYTFDAIKPEDRVPTTTILIMGLPPTMNEEEVVGFCKAITTDPEFVRARRRTLNGGAISDKISAVYRKVPPPLSLQHNTLTLAGFRLSFVQTMIQDVTTASGKNMWPPLAPTHKPSYPQGRKKGPPLQL